MSDYLLELSRKPLTRSLVRRMGLPTPQTLARTETPYEERPFENRRVAFGGVRATPAGTALRAALAAAGAVVIEAAGVAADMAVFDATGLRTVGDLKAFFNFFHPLVPQLALNARVLVVTAPPEDAADSNQAAGRRATEGIMRSLAKEIGKRGSTANLAYVEAGAEARLEGLVRYLLSPRSAYVDGQVFRVSARVQAPKSTPHLAPLKGKVALVTGGARGLGAATAQRLAEEGAQVVCLDIPADQRTLDETVRSIGGVGLALDVSDDEAPRRIAAFLRERFGGVDIVVHNAGVTRDKTIAKMDERLWDNCLAINLESIIRIDRELIENGVLRDQGRLVCLSSIAGIAGNVGQTNYAATKAAVIGYVAARGQQLAARGITANAVAPGLIETRLMQAIPFFFREFGRRLNSLSQGGVPRDVAELIGFLCTPGAAGISGQTIRVCGQNLMGA